MHYVKIDTSDGEARWLNLAQVSRVTSTAEVGSGEEILVVIFADPCTDVTLKLHASNDQDRAAIQVLKAHLDALVKDACTA